MTKDQFLREYYLAEYDHADMPGDLDKLLAAERERCAVVCDTEVDAPGQSNPAASAAFTCATLIRDLT